MAEKGLFFNAFPNDDFETGYDRNYSADDISDWLSIVCESGVVKTDSEAGTGIPQGLKVVAASGMNISVNVGKATIRGKGYVNNALLTLPIETAPTGSNSRYDLVVLRCDNTPSVDARKNYVLVISGTSNIPTVDDLTRNSNIYDLLLGYVAVRPNATSIQQADITDTRGDKELCPYFTAVKGYDDYYDAIIQQFKFNQELTLSSNSITTNIASNLYNNKYSLIQVYCNGLHLAENVDYTFDTSNQYITINFNSVKNAGAEISVILNNFVDGEGLSTAIDDYNNWVLDVENLNQLNTYNYYCNGKNDNVKISELVNERLALDGAYYQTIKLNIIGKFGMTAMAKGDGSTTTPYAVFNFDQNAGARRIELDFSNANNIVISIPDGSESVIFSGNNMYIYGASIVANNQTNTIIKVFEDNSRIKAENCRFYIYGYNSTMIGSRGTFLNCKGDIRNAVGDSYCFEPSNGGYLSIVGGEYNACTKHSSAQTSIVYSHYTNAVVEMVNVVAPTLTITSYYQTKALWHTSGKLSCFGLVTQLSVETTTGASVTGTINASVYNQIW